MVVGVGATSVGARGGSVEVESGVGSAAVTDVVGVGWGDGSGSSDPHAALVPAMTSAAKSMAPAVFTGMYGLLIVMTVGHCQMGLDRCTDRNLPRRLWPAMSGATC